MDKITAIKRFRTICRAFEYLTGDDIRRILADTPRQELPDTKNGRHHWKVCEPATGICFDLFFSDKDWNSSVGDTCKYTTAHGFARSFTLTNRERWKGLCPDYRQFGSHKYRYSISDLETMFPHEPFYLNHLSQENLKNYANDVRNEMKEWDFWLKNGSVSQSKWDEHLSTYEEQILTNYAPYMSAISSLEQMLLLF